MQALPLFDPSSYPRDPPIGSWIPSWRPSIADMKLPSPIVSHPPCQYVIPSISPWDRRNFHGWWWSFLHKVLAFYGLPQPPLYLCQSRWVDLWASFVPRSWGHGLHHPWYHRHIFHQDVVEEIQEPPLPARGNVHRPYLVYRISTPMLLWFRLKAQFGKDVANLVEILMGPDDFLAPPLLRPNLDLPQLTDQNDFLV